MWYFTLRLHFSACSTLSRAPPVLALERKYPLTHSQAVGAVAKHHAAARIAGVTTQLYSWLEELIHASKKAFAYQLETSSLR
jgi:urease accessory protein UreF